MMCVTDNYDSPVLIHIGLHVLKSEFARISKYYYQKLEVDKNLAWDL